jgi:hypothetical protein
MKYTFASLPAGVSPANAGTMLRAIKPAAANMADLREVIYLLAFHEKIANHGWWHNNNTKGPVSIQWGQKKNHCKLCALASSRFIRVCGDIAWC